MEFKGKRVLKTKVKHAKTLHSYSLTLRFPEVKFQVCSATSSLRVHYEKVYYRITLPPELPHPTLYTSSSLVKQYH